MKWSTDEPEIRRPCAASAPPACCGSAPPATTRRSACCSRTASYAGADIDMAHDLARAARGADRRSCRRVWVDLLDDFLADRFDIAMGGVTVTAPRAEKAFFSVPTFVDGKRPLCRREDRDRFTAIAAIDRPGVRVIANPGSANEAFARANFTRAQVTIHHDNATVFLRDRRRPRRRHGDRRARSRPPGGSCTPNCAPCRWRRSPGSKRPTCSRATRR